MRSLAWAVGLTLAGSLGGVLVASALLTFHDRLRVQLVPWLVSYAVGTLLGVALLVLLPEALAHLSPRAVLGSVLAGIMLARRCGPFARPVAGSSGIVQMNSSFAPSPFVKASAEPLLETAMSQIMPPSPTWVVLDVF